MKGARRLLSSLFIALLIANLTGCKTYYTSDGRYFYNENDSIAHENEIQKIKQEKEDENTVLQVPLLVETVDNMQYPNGIDTKYTGRIFVRIPKNNIMILEGYNGYQEKYEIKQIKAIIGDYSAYRYSFEHPVNFKLRVELVEIPGNKYGGDKYGNDVDSWQEVEVIVGNIDNNQLGMNIDDLSYLVDAGNGEKYDASISPHLSVSKNVHGTRWLELYGCSELKYMSMRLDSYYVFNLVPKQIPNPIKIEKVDLQTMYPNIYNNNQIQETIVPDTQTKDNKNNDIVVPEESETIMIGDGGSYFDELGMELTNHDQYSKEYIEGEEIYDDELNIQNDIYNSSNGYIVEISSESFLDVMNVIDFGPDVLKLAINEIYARHGRKFENQKINDYFNSKPWYNGTIEPEDFDNSVLSEVEISNINFLNDMIESKEEALEQ